MSPRRAHPHHRTPLSARAPAQANTLLRRGGR
eukprot:CAMPEP_0185432156 /NCGR_PEP_ID=MMETSP1365-20130426/18578_1 /TAXON_ID=38817 /ORGANISM="Gephyrocapsa oceanica, Strain RCC1303" /LENGTH=31 /DNA_ID= /DNA_START= /DNA_END= /DNA_ORIENTATION=